MACKYINLIKVILVSTLLLAWILFSQYRTEETIIFFLCLFFAVTMSLNFFCKLTMRMYTFGNVEPTHQMRYTRLYILITSWACAVLGLLLFLGIFK